MSWASRRRATYIFGIIIFFAILIGGPILYKVSQIKPTCHDGRQDQGETSVDRGGPCLLLDDSTLQPHAILWARSFPVRQAGQGSSSYSAVAYIQNPNQNAGVAQAYYEFSLYDSQNVLIATRDGVAAIMPGGVTPIFESNIDAGNRIVAHTYFEFTQPLVWERMINTAASIAVGNMQTSDTGTAPRVQAVADNTSYTDVPNITFVAVVFDTTGNAIAASATNIPDIPASAQSQIVFTWPDPFTLQVGRVDIIPVTVPVPDPAAQQ